MTLLNRVKHLFAVMLITFLVLGVFYSGSGVDLFPKPPGDRNHQRLPLARLQRKSPQVVLH
jgi:hypothetical protein